MWLVATVLNRQVYSPTYCIAYTPQTRKLSFEGGKSLDGVPYLWPCGGKMHDLSIELAFPHKMILELFIGNVY